MTDSGKLPTPSKRKKEPIREWRMLEYDPNGRDYSKTKVVKARTMEDAVKKAQRGEGRPITEDELKELLND